VSPYFCIRAWSIPKADRNSPFHTASLIVAPRPFQFFIELLRLSGATGILGAMTLSAFFGQGSVVTMPAT
jgi:hypothetical protein